MVWLYKFFTNCHLEMISWNVNTPKFVSEGCKFHLIFILRAIIGLVQSTKYKVLSLTQTAYNCILDNK